ncbi:MAG: AmmeMemoRadiSam system protein B [Nanoarchaeota archaeon]|nr:AmmeMemoRadiSam system protein B [Nanoarchaeota archaeon]
MKKKRYIRIFPTWVIYFIIILVVLSIPVILLRNGNSEINEDRNVRQAAVAGTWYPGSKSDLEKSVDDYFAKAAEPDLEKDIKGLIVPHAGYVYSGQVAAQGFNQLTKQYDKVFILASNHAQGVDVKGISVPDFTHYSTPLGEVKVSEIAQELLDHDLFVSVPAAHTTHVIEIELPFLQQKLGDFEIIPLVTGPLNFEQIQQAADILSQYIDSRSLIVVSSDLSHYHPYDEALLLDTTCIKEVEAQDFEGAAKCEACGLYAMFILLELSKRNGWQAKIVDYKNSGDTSGDKSSVVGYSSIIFYEQLLTEEEKTTLLKLARQQLESIYGEVEMEEYELTPNLRKVQGCFSTLNKDSNLRGCIGHILPQEELYKCVMDNIQNAALHDARFQPVTEQELEDIEIEISVLTVPEKLPFESGEDLLQKLRPGIDGVVLKKGFRQSTYLPQVWDMFPDAETFLSSLCMKGGMPVDCWQDTSTEVLTYQAIVFDESEIPQQD